MFIILQQKFRRNIWNAMHDIGVIFGIKICLNYICIALCIDLLHFMKNRIISNTILKKSSSHFGRIIVITGARQTGKTTLVKNIFPKYSYISIEDPVLVEEYKKLTASQWSSLYPKAILDEVQKEPQLVESIKSVYDQFPEPQYILLGSSQILLLKKIRESLAGRCQIVEMYPLTLPELMTDNWEDEVPLSYFQKIILNKPIEDKSFLLDSKHPKKKECF